MTKGCQLNLTVNNGEQGQKKTAIEHNTKHYPWKKPIERIFIEKKRKIKRGKKGFRPNKLVCGDYSRHGTPSWEKNHNAFRVMGTAQKGGPGGRKRELASR